VTDPLNSFVTAIADCVVGLVATRSETSCNVRLQTGAFDSRHKPVLEVVPMSVLGKAGPAKVEVLACRAVHKLNLGKFLHTAVASADAGVEEVVEDWNGSLRGSRSRGRLLGRLGLRLRLGSDTLRGAVDDDATLDKSFDQPVVGSVASNTLIDTLLAKIKIALIAGRAMVVRLGNGPLAAVAADRIVVPWRGQGGF
jgi:hypothetical protein